ncbi:MAG: apolipoprotein N-acyltransferase [Planctomycetes bacterium]|nr:apolipoprotein N-acyltransferase [Planctomycetota bacterium]
MPASNAPGAWSSALPLARRLAKPLTGTVALAIAHAICFFGAYPGAGIWPLAYLAVVPLAWVAINAASTRRALLTVLVVQFLAWLWTDRWLRDLTVVGYPVLALYMSLYPVLFVWLLRRLARHHLLGGVPMTLLVPVVWVGLECLRGEFLFDGYPWFLLAHPTVQLPILAQSADLLGVYFLSFLVVMVAGAIIDVARLRASGTSVGGLVVPLVVVAAVHAANCGYGGWRLGQTESFREGPTVLALQTNLPQSNKLAWSVQEQERDVRRFISRTRSALAGGGPVDLVIWPETMLPGAGLERRTIEVLKGLGPDARPLYVWGEQIVTFAGDLDTPLLVGSTAWVEPQLVEDDQPTRWEWRYKYNSAYLIQGPPPFQRYDKVFLTPFGETMPYISHWPWLENKLLALGATGMRFNLSEGRAIKRLKLSWGSARPPDAGHASGDLLTLATPICFEDVVARVCRAMIYSNGRKKADLFINLSNDGWFGSYDAGRRQHLQVARFRCIENRVPMVRVVNTGLTAAVDSRGILLGIAGEPPAVEPRTAGFRRVKLMLDNRRTLYGRLGEAWGWACLAGTAGLGIFSMRRTPRLAGRGPGTIATGLGCLASGALLWGCVVIPTVPFSTKSESVTGPRSGGAVRRVATTSAGDLRQAALVLLKHAAKSPEALVRANAIEAMHHAPEHLQPLVESGVRDPNRGVRFVAAMTIGTARMESVAPLLMPLLEDESLSVRAAAIFGLRRCGLSVDLLPLASLIRSEDPEVRGNTALVLAALGNPSAIPMIRQAVGRGMKRVAAARVKMVDLQLAETMVKLGKEGEIEAIRAALFGPGDQAEITALACMMCGRLGDERVVPNLQRLARQRGKFQQPAEVRMAATWALARINPAQAPIDVPLSYTDSQQGQLRAQAALTLGEIVSQASVRPLGMLLKDPDPLVQVAAASALLKILPP